MTKRLSKIDKIFLEDPKRMDMGKGKLAIRYGVSTATIERSKAKVREMLFPQEKDRPKRRIFFDLEVSPNIVLAWRVGGDISLSPDDIIQERAIICVCWKWEHEKKVHHLQWKKGNDKALLNKFAKIINTADEVLTQNGDNFDIKWLRTRCIYHGIPVSPKFNSIDTLKLARSGFKFNSNKLDYMGKFLGVGEKTESGYKLWKEITLNNSKPAMNKMVSYCKNDVLLLERVYVKLQNYVPPKKFKYKP